MTLPMRMDVSRPGTEAPVLAGAPVVTLADGSLGFVAHAWPADADQVVLTTADRRIAGRAHLVRSGTAYEETRARLRSGAGHLERWRLRRDTSVVLVTAEDDVSAAGRPAASPSN